MMIECSACGTELPRHETRCPICGKPTAYFHYQRRCLHCGTPAAEKSKTCMMCGQPVDSLPLRTSIYSGSWLGIGLGVLIIVGIVMWAYQYRAAADETVQAAQASATSTQTITPTPTETGTPQPTVTSTPIPTATPRTHIVEAGETLYYIAEVYGVDVDDLAALNDIDNVQFLRTGQALLIPNVAPTESGPEQMPSQIVYVIEPGDTLLGIALRYQTTIELIQLLNPNTNLDLIFPGQELVVPLATPTPTPTPTATLTPTSTPRPLHPAPALLSPADGQTVTGSTLFFNWTATSFLAADEFYVLHLTWPDGSSSEVWTKTTSWTLSQDERPAGGPISWQVAVARQTGLKADGSPTGRVLTAPDASRIVNWP
jgi:LysM repeat protein